MSETSASSHSYAGALRLNGIVWGLLVFCVLMMAATWGSYDALMPLMGVIYVSGAGMVVNGVMLLWKLVTGHFRQAATYGLGLLPLAGIFTWICHNVHLGKISG
ncbi:hypothetical protein Q5H93_21345 [Hymenobacter sp. ASUV-10]|uniref:Uncharacterized protein n=1 Tax=Hymenobacter aranciens TaxID=3063996 RepID=A0ABT9BGB8_9BACT|nr:hypothetical protein [Hymenobacter sp. ASUV-10]MDO7877304.1 hypothetical protein [Hymenobacter sp. ASUV-10]